MALRDYNAAVDFVDRNVAEGRGDKTAFIDPARNLTYGELRDAAARIAPMLARMGIEPEIELRLCCSIRSIFRCCSGVLSGPVSCRFWSIRG